MPRPWNRSISDSRREKTHRDHEPLPLFRYLLIGISYLESGHEVTSDIARREAAVAFKQGVREKLWLLNKYGDRYVPDAGPVVAGN